MQKFSLTILAVSILSFPLTACLPAEEPRPETAAQDIFFERIALLCNKAYSGRLVSNEAVDADFAGQPMIMHVARCDKDKIEIPFHIGQESGDWNRSRTWIVTRNEKGLKLKHRHRHEDGSLDSVTNYGGDTADEGTAHRQEFPVDDESIASFKANELEGSITNIWAMEITSPGQSNAKFAYELKRPKGTNARFFRVEFDLSKSVDIPPPAWGN